MISNIMIIDIQQIMIASLMAQIFEVKELNHDEDLLRHMVMNMVRNIRVKFKNDYPVCVIAHEGRNSWRKQIFPYYKANRKKNRDESALNWNFIFESFSKFSQEFKDYFSYCSIHVEEAEADDIIGTICLKYPQTKIKVISGDHDFNQLLNNPNITQYSPIQKKEISVPNNLDFVFFEHICKGDSGDGIPNILSEDDCFINKIRQKPITQKRLNEWFPNNIPIENIEKFKRNNTLINLKNTPSDIQQEIVNQFEFCLNNKKKSNLMNYAIKYKLRNLMDNLSDF